MAGAKSNTNINKVKAEVSANIHQVATIILVPQSAKESTADEFTGFVYVDKEGTWPVYIRANGSCYAVKPGKFSAKAHQFLNMADSQAICKVLGHKYTVPSIEELCKSEYVNL